MTMDIFLSMQNFSDLGTLALRIAVAVIFLVHGLPKHKMWRLKPSPQLPAPMLRIMGILAVAEPLGALALLAGFLTQLAAVGLAIIMLGAINLKMKMMKVPFKADDKTGWELDFLILAACFAVLFTGPGAYSLDRLLFGL